MKNDSSPDEQQQEQDALLKNHLGWSDRQRLILSADGRAADLYSAVRGFPFDESELPHFHLARNETRATFEAWKTSDGHEEYGHMKSKTMVIVGAWFRTLFMGESDFTSFHDEDVYNVQTQTLFVDLRIPRSRKQVMIRTHRDRPVSSLDDLTNGDELRWFARQHVFAGYSRLTNDKRPGMAGCCVRHHCLDWNYVGAKRPVPNKWWIQVSTHSPRNHPRQWKEWAFAHNDAGQPYYGEVWERLSSTPGRVGRLAGTTNDYDDSIEDCSHPVVLALRKRVSRAENEVGDDGAVVVVGDHFNYCIGRALVDDWASDGGVPSYLEGASSLVDLVDSAVARGDYVAARAWLGRIRGGHGRISSGWRIDLATDYWTEGSPFWNWKDVTVVGETMEACTLRHGPEEWDVFECSLTSVDALKSFLHPENSDACTSDELLVQPSSKRRRPESKATESN